MNATFLLKTLRYMVKFGTSINQEEDINRISYTLSQHNMDVNDVIQIVDKTVLSCQDILVLCKW